jgi:two-component system OmpR family sensor kinase
MLRSLRTRLWLTYLILIGVSLCIILGAITLYLVRNPIEVRQSIQRLKLISVIIVQRSNALINLSDPQLIDAIERVDNTFNVRVVIFDAQGNRIADSRADSLSRLSLPSLNVNRSLILQNNIIRDSNGSPWVYADRSIPGGNTLMVATPRPRVPVLTFFRDELFKPFLQAGLIAFIFAIFFAFWMARWITAPLQRIASASVELADGRHAKITPEGPQEVRNLAQVFNEMSARVYTTQQSQKDLLSNVSHELKTPLTSIQGFTQAIIDGTINNQEDLQKAAKIIYTEAERMQRLVVNLLDIAKLDSGISLLHISPVDINELLSQVERRFIPFAKVAGVQLNLEVEPVPDVPCDADRISQVFINLVDNAIKYSEKDGRVILSTKLDDPYVEILVTDSGPGIPQDELKRIFERFYQVDKARSGGRARGVGLGLPIARAIVERHHGTIEAFNNADLGIKFLGSTFKVRLPLMDAQNSTEAK